MPKQSEPDPLPVEYSSSEVTSSESESSGESDFHVKQTPLKHVQTEKFDEAKYLTETSIEIDYQKSISEDLESLYPLRSVEIRENRDTTKEFCDMDRNFPFDPVPQHTIRFYVYSPTERVIFKASHLKLKKHNRYWASYLFDVLFLLPGGQFVFRVQRRPSFGSHCFRANCFGNIAVVSAGDFGKKYLGQVIQKLFCRKKRVFKFEDSHGNVCLLVEAPRASWSVPGPGNTYTANLEIKFPNGNLFATMEFKGNYVRPKVTRRWSLKWPSIICSDSTTKIKFEEFETRLPIELKALVFGGFFLFYHQYWEFKRVGYCPLFLSYIILGGLFFSLMYYAGTLDPQIPSPSP